MHSGASSIPPLLEIPTGLTLLSSTLLSFRCFLFDWASGQTTLAELATLDTSKSLPVTAKVVSQSNAELVI